MLVPKGGKARLQILRTPAATEHSTTALRSPCPVVISDPSTPSRFCRQGSGVSRLPQSPGNPGTPSERTPRHLGQERVHRPPASASSEFPYQGLPWGAGPGSMPR